LVLKVPKPVSCTRPFFLSSLVITSMVASITAFALVFSSLVALATASISSVLPRGFLTVDIYFLREKLNYTKLDITQKNGPVKIYFPLLREKSGLMAGIPHI